MNNPGGTLPEVIVKVSTAPLLVSRNPSYGWPTAAAGSTQTPLTSLPPLVLGEHSKVIGRDWASAGPAAAMPASSAPAAATAATVFLIMSSSRARVAGRRTPGGPGGQWTPGRPGQSISVSVCAIERAA